MTAEPHTDAEVLRLGAIYRRCIDDLEGIGGFDVRSAVYDRVMGRLSECVGEALQVLTNRCERCDATPAKTLCATCILGHDV